MTRLNKSGRGSDRSLMVYKGGGKILVYQNILQRQLPVGSLHCCCCSPVIEVRTIKWQRTVRREGTRDRSIGITLVDSRIIKRNHGGAPSTARAAIWPRQSFRCWICGYSTFYVYPLPRKPCLVSARFGAKFYSRSLYPQISPTSKAFLKFQGPCQ